MNQQPDKLFRDKLQGYQQPVSPDAWNRVSQNLNKKGQRGIWLRAAAAVLLLVTSGIFLYPVLRKSAEPGETVAESTPAPAKQQPPTAAKDPAAIQSAETKKEDITNTQGTTQRNTRTQQKRRAERPAPRQQATLQEEDETQDMVITSKENVAINIEESTPDLSAEAVPPTEVHPKTKSVTIVFTSQEVNEKYLIKNTEQEATPETKEASGFKRLLDKAHDLTTNQDLLGDLRQKKNEILAMNFRNEKERTEKN